MKVEHLIGRHRPNDGEGLTVEDLIKLLMQLPPKARKHSYVTVVTESGHSLEVIGMGVGQSDQAEDHEASISLLLDKPVVIEDQQRSER